MRTLPLTYKTKRATKGLHGNVYKFPKKGAVLNQFGFNGQLKDNEIYGEGNAYSFEYRIHDPRLVRFLSLDPLRKEYPWYSPYQFAGNKTIWAKDLEGLEEFYTTSGEYLGKLGIFNTEIRIVYDDFVSLIVAAINEPNHKHSNVAKKLVMTAGSSKTFDTTDEAAEDWANKYNERSIVEDTEYASSMYYLKINNKNVVFYDKPEKGERDNVTVVIDLKEGKRKLAGLIHSHSATSKDHLANQFSEKDLDVFKKYKTIGYVATPSGKLLQNVLGDKEATSIISDKIPSDKNDPESPLYFKTKSNSNE